MKICVSDLLLVKKQKKIFLKNFEKNFRHFFKIFEIQDIDTYCKTHANIALRAAQLFKIDFHKIWNHTKTWNHTKFFIKSYIVLDFLKNCSQSRSLTKIEGKEHLPNRNMRFRFFLAKKQKKIFFKNFEKFSSSFFENLRYLLWWPRLKHFCVEAISGKFFVKIL
jgi:hypothetical protein